MMSKASLGEKAAYKGPKTTSTIHELVEPIDLSYMTSNLLLVTILLV
jgi:hypothetical protein